MSGRRRQPGAPASAALAMVVIVMALLGSAPALSAQSFPEFTAPVVDTAGVVPDDVEMQVNSALKDYQARSGNQVAVAVVRTTGKRSIEDYGIDLAREWGVGEKGDDNGVLLLIAIEDRKLRIEVGRGLEGTLTDLQSGRIIRERLVPLLRQGDVAGAVIQGTLAIRRELGDTEAGPLPELPQDDTGSEGGSPWPLLFVLPVLGLGLLGGRRRRGRGGFGGFGGFGPPIFWGGGLGGGGFGGGGGGGFGGGGGGSFGGGGASGGW